jgi:AmpD protein
VIVAWARQEPTPNRSSREGSAVDCVVIHHISLPPGEFGGPFIVDLFLNRLDPKAHEYFKDIAGIRVSSHFLIDRMGELAQFVDTAEAAWHAGVSSWKGRENVNLFSVGIELEGDMVSGYTEAQYETLGKLLRELKEEYPVLDADRLTGHEHIAPGRKTDPGPLFDWERARGFFKAFTSLR